MTGVGHFTSSQEQHAAHLIGNLPPSIVARPEIVLEGYDQASRAWLEIPFRYKPTDLFKPPPVNFPHQPRLDWQMWFAALGSYEHNPWLVHLLHKLLTAEDNPEVLALLDTDSYPFRSSSSTSGSSSSGSGAGPRAPVSIRSTLYEFDFTRLDYYWNRNIPRTEILPNSSLASSFVSSLRGQQQQDERKQQAWWQRKRVIREYLPALDLSNPSLNQFLKGHGFSLRPPISPTQQEERCLKTAAAAGAGGREGVWSGSWQRMVCQSVFEARRRLPGDAVWRVVWSVLVLMLFQIAFSFWRQRRGRGRTLGR
jgi:hypothetical protein